MCPFIISGLSNAQLFSELSKPSFFIIYAPNIFVKENFQKIYLDWKMESLSAFLEAVDKYLMVL